MFVEQMVSDSGDVFIRQRRNLVIASTFITIYAISDLKVDKLNFILASGDIKDATTLLWFMWGICAYFLYRFNAINSGKLWKEFFDEIERTYYRLVANAATVFVRVEYTCILAGNWPSIKNAEVTDSNKIEGVLVESSNENIVLINHMYHNSNAKNKGIINTRVIEEVTRPEFIVFASKNGDVNSTIISVRVDDLLRVKIYAHSLWINMFDSSFFGEKLFPYIYFCSSTGLYFLKIMRS
jgi:hypothetical protein